MESAPREIVGVGWRVAGHPSSYRKGALGGPGEPAGCTQELDFNFWFRQKAQSITISEDLVPGSEVVRVQATGFNLLYEIISPRPSLFYSIGQGEGRSGAGIEDVLNWERARHRCDSFLKVWIESPDPRGRGRNGQDRVGLTWGRTEVCFFLHPLYTLS